MNNFFGFHHQAYYGDKKACDLLGAAKHPAVAIRAT